MGLPRLSCLLFFIFSNQLSIQAQELISTSGGSLEENSILFNWSIGELVTGAGFSESRSISIGFNQVTDKIYPLRIINSSKSTIQIFPNPTDGLFFLSDNLGQIKSVKLVSSQGLMIPLKYDHSMGEIDISFLAAGVYFLEVSRSDNSTHCHKIVKY